MHELSLFSGAGGGLLASHLLGFRPIGYVEWDDYCQRVIAQRIKDGLLPEAHIYSDIRAFTAEGYAERYRGMVDVVSGGFPCQPFSVAGKRQGEDDARNMWPATVDVLRAVRPPFAFLENVPGLLAAGVRFCDRCGGSDFGCIEPSEHESGRVQWCVWCGLVLEDASSLPVDRYFGRVLRDLAEIGFDVRWCVLGAIDVGAPHVRKRLWIRAELANAQHGGREGRDKTGRGASSAVPPGSISNTHCNGCGGLSREAGQGQDGSELRPDTQRQGSGHGGAGAAQGSLPNAERVDLREQRKRAGQQRGEQRPAEPRDDGEARSMADAESEPERSGFREGESRRIGRGRPVHGGRTESMADADSKRQLQQGRGECAEWRRSCDGGHPWWRQDPADDPESGLGRVASGVANRVDRVRALGNGQVPSVAALAWRLLSDA